MMQSIASLKSRAVLVLVLMVLSCASYAQRSIVFQEAPLVPIRPMSGGYFNPESPGNGIMLEVARDGFVFGAFFYYDALGVGKWATVQGPCTPASETTRMLTDEICRVRADAFYEARGGQCWGCPWTANSTFPSAELNQQVEVVFLGNDRGEIRANGTVMKISRIANVYPGQSKRNRLIGTWSRIAYRTLKDCPTCSPYAAAQELGKIYVIPAETPVKFWNVPSPANTDGSTLTGIPFPSNSAPQYHVFCADPGGAEFGYCPHFDARSGERINLVLIEEPESGQIRVLQPCLQGPVFPIPNCRLVEDGPGGIVTSYAIKERSDLYLFEDTAIWRRAPGRDNQFSIWSEEVWTRNNGFRLIPIREPFPY